MRERMVELGRSCVHAEHRHGGAILALWGALFEFMARNQLDTMIGCASIPMLHNGIVSKSLSQTFCGDMMMFKDVQDFMPGESATTRQYRAIFL